MNHYYTYDCAIELTITAGYAVDLDIRLTYTVQGGSPGYFDHVTGNAEPPSDPEIEIDSVQYEFPAKSKAASGIWLSLPPPINDLIAEYVSFELADKLIEHAREAA